MIVITAAAVAAAAVGAAVGALMVVVVLRIDRVLPLIMLYINTSVNRPVSEHRFTKGRCWK